MSNNITIELCAEDRARLDRLAEALERRVTQAEFIMAQEYGPAEPDPIQQKLTEVLANAKQAAEAPQEPAGAAEAETPATTQEPEEKPATEAKASEEAPVVTVDDIRQKYVALVASGKKDEARDTIKGYGVTKISDIPAEQCAEVLAKLIALEG